MGLDSFGTLLLGLSLVAYALGVTLGRSYSGAAGAGLLVAAACGTDLFIHVEKRVAFPLIPAMIFRDPCLGANLAIGFLVATVMMTTLVVGPSHLATGLGLSAAAAGLVLSSGPLVVALVAMPAGRLADLVGTKRMVKIGLLGLSVGAFGLSQITAADGIARYIAMIALISAGYVLFQTANTAQAMRDVAFDQRSVTSGLLNLSRNLDIITGVSAMGTVFSFTSRAMPEFSVSVASSHASDGAMHVTPMISHAYDKKWLGDENKIAA